MMNTINISVRNNLNAAAIIKKVYKQGDIEYNIYNYNKRDSKSRDFSASGYTESQEQFDEQLAKQLNEDSEFCKWSIDGGLCGKKMRTDETFTVQLPNAIVRDTCEPTFCKISKACKDNNISFEELLDIYNNDENYHRYGNCRSVVTCNDTIVTIAPIKSSSFDTFKSINQGGQFDFTKQLYANEVIEGTMINLFYNKLIDSWEIATKSAIGGNYWFYRTQYNDSIEFDKQMTFRQMFMEALGEDQNSELNSSYVVQQLNMDYSYSFVMQHPANHIVLNITNPTLYLVAGFKIDCDNITQYSPYDMTQIAFSGGSVDNSPILLPRMVDISGKNVDELIMVAEQFNAGIMLHSKLIGKRIKIVNNTYERLKDIRGNNPNIHYHYLSLFTTGHVNEFLTAFPVYKKLFNQFYRQSYDFIKEIHDAYVSYYVNKNGKSIRINKSLFTHIYALHTNYYIPSIDSERPIIIRRNVVANYYNAMTPKEKLFHVNYKTREFTNKQNK